MGPTLGMVLAADDGSLVNIEANEFNAAEASSQELAMRARRDRFLQQLHITVCRYDACEPEESLSVHRERLKAILKQLEICCEPDVSNPAAIHREAREMAAAMC